MDQDLSLVIYFIAGFVLRIKNKPVNVIIAPKVYKTFESTDEPVCGSIF